MFAKVLLIVLLAQSVVSETVNVTLGSIRGYLPGINDAFRMFKPGLTDLLWNTGSIGKNHEIPNTEHDTYSINGFSYVNTTATLDPNGYIGYLNVTNLVFVYDYTYTSLYDGLCSGYLQPDVEIDWLLLKYRVRMNEPCSIQIESLVPEIGNSRMINLDTENFQGDCSSNQFDMWIQDFVDAVDNLVLEQMPLAVDSFLANQAYNYLPGWRKIVSSNPFYVLRFEPCFPSFSMTTKELLLGVGLAWNSTGNVDKKEFHMNLNNKQTANNLIKKSELYLCVFFGIIIGVLTVFGGDKYLQKRKQINN